MTGALDGLRVLDLTRVLAGPICTQLLGDMGADIIKIERPGQGDDTRAWGPPFLKGHDGNDTSESAYYLCANRNKRSVAIDIATLDGQNLIHRLLEQSDILIENFKTGGLEKYGLGYDQLRERYPRLIYCSITGFGQNGPLATEPGYDFLVQGMSGFMASTGAADNGPTKAGVAISDYVTGLYAAIGILAAVNARHTTGRGQMVDCSLLDSSIAMMTNVAQYFLTSGRTAPRVGNAHSTIVPYQEFQTADGYVIVAVGNDHQFAVLARTTGHPEWADDMRFKTNRDRVSNRDILIPLIALAIRTRTTDEWLKALREVDVPVGPIYTMDRVFSEPQAIARQMQIEMTHPAAPTPIQMVGCAVKMSESQVSYRQAPPMAGQHTDEVLGSLLNLDEESRERLRARGVIG